MFALGVANLFGLPAPVYAVTVPVLAPSITPRAAACERSSLAAKVDKSGPDTIIQDQRLANYEARLRQEGSVHSPDCHGWCQCPAQCWR